MFLVNAQRTVRLISESTDKDDTSDDDDDNDDDDDDDPGLKTKLPSLTDMVPDPELEQKQVGGRRASAGRAPTRSCPFSPGPPRPSRLRGCILRREKT